MVCRENPAGSIAIALTRRQTWLDDSQLQSIFHRLSHEHHADAPPASYDRQVLSGRALLQHRTAITSDPVLGAQQRQSLLRRLEAAERAGEDCPDGVYWAISRFDAGLVEAQSALDGRLRKIAGQRGMSMREARAEFLQLRTEMPPVGRGGNTAPSSAERADLGVIPTDGRTRFALAQMTSRPPVRPPRSAVDRESVVATTAGQPESRVAWSTTTQRVEVTSAGETTAWRVPRSAIDAFASTSLQRRPTPGQVAALTAMGERVTRFEQERYCLRCDDCGQYLGDNPHECPVLGTTTQTLRRVEVNDAHTNVSLPSPLQLVDTVQARNGLPVQVPVVVSTAQAVVDGHITVRAGSEVVRGLDRGTRQRIDVDDRDPGELLCRSCRSVDCSHVAQARERVRQCLRGAGGLPRERRAEAAQAAIEIVERAAGPETSRPETSGTAPPAAAAERATLSLAADPEAFREIITSSGSGANRRVPLHLEDGVLADCAPGTRFGIEIEFNSDDYRGTTTGLVTQRLHQAGLLQQAQQGGYHSAGRDGYRNWTLERDGSVPSGGELVTPVLSDTQSSWQQLATACEAIGIDGVNTHEAGSHTNISADGYTPENAWSLTNLFRAHADDLHRMGRTRGSRRDTGYNSPLVDPGPRWDTPYVVRRNQRVRESAINFNNAFGTNPRIEFRFPDASLDAGVMQAQVKLCAAMTRYARENSVEPEGDRRRGSAASEGWARRLFNRDRTSPDEFAERTHPVRNLIDRLFTTDRDRQQIAVLWGRGAYL